MAGELSTTVQAGSAVFSLAATVRTRRPQQSVRGSQIRVLPATFASLLVRGRRINSYTKRQGQLQVGRVGRW